ncbi:Acetyl xylan esterase [Beutenbergia cavernae DSM 12333]|uniref:Acetyl xylan esterase n=1 Tax=Beutenbergia cavernae (strain ATCC BAA-8 / DSM 12333 / CCUG 43141 / JCM 11478 / NBRC 16432 / NCIMB 13614 / HKI 0122) TaxID=471853 RepID=C5C5T9_BEUC1|nr:acetylxylan esterase [Beutenbergia cavernae]ACQ82297.1 Acetyl xylan esterase [Beutenbergia cavernae DSM 12333]
MNRLTGATVAPELVPDPGFDATYGHTLEDLLHVSAPADEPADFDAFWASVRAETSAVDPLPEVSGWRPLPGHEATHEVADLSYRSLDDAAIGGWVVRPTDGAEEVVVVGHGYGGRSDPGLDGVPPRALAVMPVARGLGSRSVVPGIGNDALPHVLWGIETPRSYSHVGSTADLWLAVTIGLALVPEARRLTYHGGSFGGGIGALALAFDDRFDGGYLEVPSFGDYPWRAGVDCLGSGRWVRAHLREHPEALETLRYADAATAAGRVRVPVVVAPALADPSVPPPSQFAVANALGGPTWLHALPAGHSEWVGSDAHERPDDASIRRFLLEQA